MVELSIEVMEGLRDPLIGLRCWISRCTCTTFELAVAQRLQECMRGIHEFSYNWYLQELWIELDVLFRLDLDHEDVN